MSLLSRLSWLLAAALLLAGCGVTAPTVAPSPSGSPTATLAVASDGTADSALLAEIVTQALVAKGRPAAVTTLPTADALAAVTAGSVAVLPAFARGLLAGVSGSEAQLSVEAMVQQLATDLEDEAGVIQASGIDAGGRYVVTEAFATKHKLTSLTELGSVEELRLVGPGAASALSDGPSGLLAVYGVKATWSPQDDPALRISALESDTADVAYLSRIDLAGAALNLVTLEDPLGVLQPDPQVLLITPALRDDLDVLEVLQAVQTLLTDENFAALRVQAGNAGVGPAVHGFLATNGLA
ncbi:MAG: hypothetical protein IPL43_00600 [Micropruina sp.]|nr:hypothetical protein [Micropruina sp.]